MSESFVSTETNTCEATLLATASIVQMLTSHAKTCLAQLGAVAHSELASAQWTKNFSCSLREPKFCVTVVN